MKSIDRLSDLTPDPKNARRHSARGRGMLETGIHEVGAARSIVIDEDGVVLAGNLTVEAAGKAGISRVQVVDADGATLVAVRRTGLTAAQKRRLALYDNRVGELSDFDPAQIGAIMAEDRSALDGLFTHGELARIVTKSGPAWDGGQDPNEKRRQQLRAKWPTEAGQLWLVPSLSVPGRSHRLLCADPEDPEAIARLLDGVTPDGIVSDVPDGLDPRVLHEVLDPLADLAVLLVRGEAAFTFLASGIWRYGLDLTWKRQTQPPEQTSKGPIQHHETVLMAVQGLRTGLEWKRPDPAYASVIEVTVREYVDVGLGHGKPAELFQEMLRGFTEEVWVDPFLRSGPSLLGCEVLGKQLYGCEADPDRLATALERASGVGLRPVRAE